MDNRKKLADIWLLISSLNCVRYAIAELNPATMPPQSKVKYKGLKIYIENFLNTMQLHIEVDKRKKLVGTNFENVGAMVETMACLAHIPLDQIEPFLEKVNQLAFETVKQVTDEKDSTNGTDRVL
jgi:hypothetical protein